MTFLCIFVEGNRIDVPCVVHANAAAETDQKQETKTSTAAG